MLFVLPIIASSALCLLYVATAQPNEENDHPQREDNWRHWHR